MAKGPGIYDHFVTPIREETEADCVMLIVMKSGGESGFSVQSAGKYTYNLPKLLRALADRMESDLSKTH